MKTPTATYRVQLNKSFGFNELKAIIPYLAKLGISHVYSSPIFQAKKGSAHGYDIVDSNQISDELGGASAFEDLSREVAAYGLGWMQDIVPNHVSYSPENRRIWDLMEKGVDSKYHAFLDVDWKYPSRKLKGRILAPFLEKPFSECLKQGQISLVFNDGFKIKFGKMEFPVSIKTSKTLLSKNSIRETINQYNGSPKLLAALLSRQVFALAYWKTALKHINYRRFFDITNLIGLRMEEPGVFEDTHRLILELIRTGKITALRVDHIDGLFKPEEYLQTLREKAPETYVVVEKILMDKEELPGSWPVWGSTGYDFVNYVNRVFIKEDSEEAIDDFYKQFTANTQAFSELLFDCKKTVIENSFLGDAKNLSRQINQALSRMPYCRKYSAEKMLEAVIELLVCFPVYRTYLNEKDTGDKTGYFRLALEHAKQRNSALAKELEAIDYLFRESRNMHEPLQVMMRLQQFTGSIMAKGLEDTAFYRYNRFLSLNEVGSNPGKFGCTIKEFHDFNLSRQQKGPLSMNATSTHDTKRGEDVRARLNVTSELPEEFKERTQKWAEINAKEKTKIKNKLAPSPNEEYYFYQTLLGAFPFDKAEIPAFTERMTAHMVKALREAKGNSSWLTPNAQYEEAVTQFITNILSNQRFLKAFLPFQKKIAYYGFFNTLSQTLLKITCPGVPDFYQGSELWDLNLVDPDNRRPVDYQKRQKWLSEVSIVGSSEAYKLLGGYETGKAKLYIIYKALKLRRKAKNLFEEGTYLPLAVEGKEKEHVVAFARKKEDLFAVTVVPRFLASILKPQCTWATGTDWKDTCIVLPNNSAHSWRDVFTGVRLRSEAGKLYVKDVLGTFPVALLISGEAS